MLKKEITSILRYSRYWLTILASIMLVLIVNAMLNKGWGTFREGLLLVPQLLLLIYPLLLGLSFFSEEQQQKGMEYLLSLPYTRLQIVWTKLLVRLAALILLFIPFFILFNANPFNSILFPVLSFSIAYFVFFTISFSLSCLQENSLVGFVLAAFLSALYLVAVFLVYRLPFIFAGSVESNISTVRDLLNLEKAGDIYMGLSISQWSFWLVLLILLLPFLAAFFRVARNLDLRQARRKKTFALTFGLLMPLAFLVAAGLVYATMDWSAYGGYYLSLGKRLLQMPWGATMRIHDQKGSHKISVPGQLFATVLGEKAGLIYIISWQREGEELLQLEDSSGKWRSIYQSHRGFRLGWSDRAGNFEQDIFVLETPENDQGAMYLLIYDILGRKLRRVKFAELQPGPRGYVMIGAGRANGKSFVLISSLRKRGMPVQRLWEDGRAEKLAGTEHLLSLYLGGKLIISGKEGVKIFSLTTTDQPKLEKVLPGLIIPGWYSWRNSDSFDFSAALSSREVLLSRGGEQYNVLNLQTYGQKIISTNPGTTFHALVWPFFRESTGNGFSILRCQDGQLETLGSIHFQFKEDRDGAWFENGIVTRQNKKVRAYAFPDLRELIFPDL